MARGADAMVSGATAATGTGGGAGGESLRGAVAQPATSASSARRKDVVLKMVVRCHAARARTTDARLWGLRRVRWPHQWALNELLHVAS
jgi:hypothetical protein